jgi:hypothetical protein
MLGFIGATPVGMPLPAIPDALSKGTIDGCVIPWEVVPSVKVHELTKFHSEFDNSGGALYTTTFVMGMNKAKYNSLAPDLKKVIDNNSGMATSGWLGKVQQGNDPERAQGGRRPQEHDLQDHPGRRPGIQAQGTPGRGGMGAGHGQARLRRQEALETARTLIEKHGKTNRRPRRPDTTPTTLGGCFAVPLNIAGTAARQWCTGCPTTATPTSALSALPATPSTTRTP